MKDGVSVGKWLIDYTAQQIRSERKAWLEEDRSVLHKGRFPQDLEQDIAKTAERLFLNFFLRFTPSKQIG